MLFLECKKKSKYHKKISDLLFMFTKYLLNMFYIFLNHNPVMEVRRVGESITGSILCVIIHLDWAFLNIDLYWPYCYVGLPSERTFKGKVT